MTLMTGATAKDMFRMCLALTKIVPFGSIVKLGEELRKKSGVTMLWLYAPYQCDIKVASSVLCC